MNVFKLVLLSILLFFASCKIKTQIHFHNDNSGTVTITYDLTELYAESGGMDSTGGVVDSIAESLQKMDTLKFLKKYKVVKTDYGIDVSYSFDNLDDLNHSFDRFMQGDQMMERTTGTFVGKRNKMVYTLNNPSRKSEEDEIISSMETEGLFDWEFKVSFEKKIKKCSNSNFTINESENSITQTGTLRTFQDPEKMNFKVKLK